MDVIQLRDKCGSAADIIRLSTEIIRFTKQSVLYIINDRVDIAHAIDCDGVHIGQDDIPLDKARALLGPRKIIGVSCQSLRQSIKAQEGGADYIGFGSVFKTLTKPERQPMELGLLRKVLNRIDIPVFPIGGIDRAGLAVLQRMGVERAAICRAICEAKDVTGAARYFKRTWEASGLL